MWAHNLLKMCEMAFGRDRCIVQISKKRGAITMFSGIECARMAWCMIEKASEDLWGTKTGLHFKFAVLGMNLYLYICYHMLSLFSVSLGV